MEDVRKYKVFINNPTHRNLRENFNITLNTHNAKIVLGGHI
jgi:hypothetical protein